MRGQKKTTVTIMAIFKKRIQEEKINPHIQLMINTKHGFNLD